MNEEKLKTFVDLFCGLGGFRIACEKQGLECVFSAENNIHACEIYEKNFNDNPFCDITTLNPESMPDFDLLCAGFPCQPFSKAGKQLGFKDERGNIFFKLCEIIRIKKPKVILFENVKHLLSHDKGNTFSVIKNSLEQLEYNISYKILNSKDFSVPQNRERIIIVGIFKKYENMYFDFESIVKQKEINMIDCFDFSETEIVNPEKYVILKNYKRQKSGITFCGYIKGNQRKNGVLEGKTELSRNHKQFNRINHISGIHPAILSQETSGRHYVYDGKNVHKIGIENCFKLMGFPEDYKKIGPKSQLYNRIGNSVCIPMIENIVQKILEQTIKI